MVYHSWVTLDEYYRMSCYFKCKWCH